MDAAQIQNYIELGFTVIGFASAIAAIIPVPQAIVPLMFARKILDIVAMNFGHAKNAK